VNSIISKMIWNEELSASIDQSGGVVVFHRIELTRPQQLAQTLAEKVAAMVEQNEKAIDLKLGNTPGWTREDGNKGGEQTQERRGRREGARGGLRGALISRCIYAMISIYLCRRSKGWTRRTFRAGSRQPNVGWQVEVMIGVWYYACLLYVILLMCITKKCDDQWSVFSHELIRMARDENHIANAISNLEN
jgi:hypothetical protein